MRRPRRTPRPESHLDLYELPETRRRRLSSRGQPTHSQEVHPAQHQEAGQEHALRHQHHAIGRPEERLNPVHVIERERKPCRRQDRHGGQRQSGEAPPHGAGPGSLLPPSEGQQVNKTPYPNPGGNLVEGIEPQEDPAAARPRRRMAHPGRAPDEDQRAADQRRPPSLGPGPSADKPAAYDQAEAGQEPDQGKDDSAVSTMSWHLPLSTMRWHLSHSAGPGPWPSRYTAYLSYATPMWNKLFTATIRTPRPTGEKWFPASALQRGWLPQACLPAPSRLAGLGRPRAAQAASPAAGPPAASAPR